MLHSPSIKQLETKSGQISTQLNTKLKGGLPSDTIMNLKNDAQVLTVVTNSGKTLSDYVVDVKKRTQVENTNMNKKKVVE